MSRPLPAAVAVLVTLAAGSVAAQSAATTGLASRRTTAISYEARRTTTVDLIGTPLLPRSRGRAEIKTGAAGPVHFKVNAKSLTPPTQFGSEYLTYVLWAIPPQGRAKNLGEVRVNDGEAALTATADVQTFALIVTAEPYYAVTTPSEVVVMENAAREDTKGRTSVATLEYEIVRRGAYIQGPGGAYATPVANRKEPPDVQQARNALAIANVAGADRLAENGYANAGRLLDQTDALVKAKASSRDVISHARATVQAAEEARMQALRQQQRLADEAARERAAQDAAARLAAERAAQDAASQRQQADQARLAAEQSRREAEQARAEAEQLRTEAQEQASRAQQEAARAEAARAAAEADRTRLRATLLRQFNDILETRDTARGLVVNIGDVLFETGRYELRPAAREKLARFAGIILAHPGLAVQAEGFTDSTGTDAVNARLSRQRAEAVGDFLIDQGMARARVTARGFGADRPVATNGTREGRQANRRVELVVAGDIIGTPIGAIGN